MNSSIAEVPYLDGVADLRDVTINMDGGSVGYLWGTYQYSDVASGTITHNISGGEVGRLYGGANLNDATNVRPGYTPGQVQGIVINMTGGNVGQIRVGNSSGEGGADSAQSVYAGGRKSTVDSTEINISGGSIEGNVYGGGTYDNGVATVTNYTKVTISGGAIDGDVYAAGKNDQVGGNTSIVMLGNTASVSGTLNGGSDNSAAATRLTSRMWTATPSTLCTRPPMR